MIGPAPQPPNNNVPPPTGKTRKPRAQPPRFQSVYNHLVVRLRKANTIFQDRVKLVLTQNDMQHWSFLDLPYLLVVPTQTRAPQQFDPDAVSFVSPRLVQLVAQFDDFESEESFLSANWIDAAERQLIYVLAMWCPPGIPGYSGYKPTEYAGMSIKTVEGPNVKVSYVFVLKEEVVLSPDPVIVDPDEIPEGYKISDIRVGVHDDCCVETEESVCDMPRMGVDYGTQQDNSENCEPECPPILGE